MLIYSRYNINGGFLMKKIISFALVLSMLLLVLCSCGSKKAEPDVEKIVAEVTKKILEQMK